MQDPLCVLVDDDKDFLTVAHRFLSIIRPELEVREFFSGIEALEFLAHHRVDLVITDFRMPFIDGLQLASAVREVDRDVPIVMLSGDELEDRALAHGINAFVSKKSMGTELSAVIQQLVQARS